MTSPLSEFVSSLGAACKAEPEGCEQVKPTAVTDTVVDQGIDWFDATSAGTVCPKYSLPALSLDHDNHESHSSKCQIHGKAAALLAREFSLEEWDSTTMQPVPTILLENLHSSFSTLVDARIMVYAKVLRSHSLSMAQSHEQRADPETGLNAVEYKLKTLLEIGSNITADSVATKFSILGDEGASTEMKSAASLPMKIEARFSDVHVSRPGHQCQEVRLPVVFEAPGTVTGKWNDESKLQSINVDIDCNMLLSSMIEQATLVVAAVVDLTNQCWTDAASDLDSTKLSGCGTKVAMPSLVKSNTYVPSIEPPLSLVRPSETDLVARERYESLHAECDRGYTRRCDYSNEGLDEKNASILIENATHIVDFVIGEIGDIISQPPIKRQRLEPDSHW